VVADGRLRVIPNREGENKTPSVVAFTDGGEVLVGAAALRQAVLNPRRTVSSFKRLMGRPPAEVVGVRRPYRITRGARLTEIEIDGRSYTPPELAALVLRHLKETAEEHLDRRVSKAVVTVPAYFNDAQRQATLEAARLAGFDTDWEIVDPASGKKARQRMRIINEPTAAALAYDASAGEAVLVVFHLGGGTCDVSILEVGQGVFKVEAVHGDTNLGGDDFDTALVDHFAEAFQRQHGLDPRDNPVALRRLHDAAEQTKKDLSGQTMAEVRLPHLLADAAGAKHFETSLTRGDFERLIGPLVRRCRAVIERALTDARLKRGDIHEVLLAGGMTRVPCVRQMVRDVFGKEGRHGVNPDEVVAVGAAIQGHELLLGSRSDIVLVDVTPLTLGVETEGGVLTHLIERNTSIPHEAKQVFSTGADEQAAISLRLFQGEGKHAGAAENCYLGEVVLGGIRAAAKGQARIEATFSLDHNGILNVQAKDLDTGAPTTAHVVGVGSVRAGGDTGQQADPATPTAQARTGVRRAAP
jgi:molecular chaperone DnaK